MFYNLLKRIIDDSSLSVTENGALGYKTSGQHLTDINFAITSLRNASEDEIIDKFVKAFYEDKKLAMRWLFYVRDVREGVGERRLFRVIVSYLIERHPSIAKVIIPLIPIYGRYDDWLVYFDTSLEDEVIAAIKQQLEEDMAGMAKNEAISLLAKWLPSVNTSSEESRRLAKKIIAKLDMTERQYRKLLAKLRAYLKVIETYMSKGEWDKIDYSTVPSRANLVYNKAFLRNDEARRREFLASLEKGEVKMNAGVLFPHDILHKYINKPIYYFSSVSINPKDTAVEGLWNALPDFVNGDDSTICVADGSGSMFTTVGGTQITAWEVATSLAIYFAERAYGGFKNKYITFSENPQLVDLSKADSLNEKVEIALRHSEIANTNIKRVFDLILKTAVKNKMSQEQIPKRILILSDMEFDYCATNCGETIFKMFEREYAGYGYKLPKLIFWNICSRTGTIPMKENDLGVALVSGFSPAVMKTVFGDGKTPYDCLKEQLMTERYDAVEEALKDIIK